MPDIFDSHPGAVLRVKGGNTEPFIFQTEGWGGYDSFRAIMTSVGLERRAKVSVQESLANSVHVYTMGEKPGPLPVTGIFFQDSCVTSPRGFEQLQGYFDHFNISARGAPIGITIGGRSWQALMLCLVCMIDKPELGIGRFSMELLALPPVGARNASAQQPGAAGTTTPSGNVIV
jgi:hypothetical protein